MSSLTEFVEELRSSLPIPYYPKKLVIDRPESTLYNIHKRSIPVSIDKPIVIGVTRDEADKELLRLIHQESKRRVTQVQSQTENIVYFYFDIIPMEPMPFERDVYYNDGSPVL